MTLINFMMENPGWTFLIIAFTVYYIYVTINRIIRGMNIRKNGWPPPHCDADGDLKNQDKD